jgi:ELWxxDGT repeat protein
MMETASGHRILLQPAADPGTFVPVRTEIFYPQQQCLGEPFSYAMGIGQAVYPLSGGQPFATKDGRLLGRSVPKSVLLTGGCQNIENWDSLSSEMPHLYNSLQVGNLLYFSMANGLWVTDGSPLGTRLLRQFDGQVDQLTLAGTTVYFSAMSNNSGHDLWRTNGTEAGTTLVADINPGSSSSSFSILSVMNGYAILDDYSVTPRALRSVNLSNGSQTVLDSLQAGGCSYYGERAVVGDKLYLVRSTGECGPSVSQSVLQTDGTVGSGTNGAKIDLVAGAFDESYSWLRALGNRLIFVARTTASGSELWAYDGTNAPTLLADINPGTLGSEPQPQFVAGGKLFFSASEPNKGRELYATDGTTAGTALFLEFAPGPANGLQSVSSYSQSSNLVYFVLQTEGSGASHQIWKTDGTIGNTAKLVEWPLGSWVSFYDAAHSANGTVLFRGNNTISGDEVWKISGNSVSLVADIIPGSSGSNPNWFSVGSDGRFYFSAASASGSGSQGHDLWSSDGTSQGTRRVLWRQAEDGLSVSYIRALPGGLVFQSRRPDFGTIQQLLVFQPGIPNTFPSEGMAGVIALSGPVINPSSSLVLQP